MNLTYDIVNISQPRRDWALAQILQLISVMYIFVHLCSNSLTSEFIDVISPCISLELPSSAVCSFCLRFQKILPHFLT